MDVRRIVLIAGLAVVTYLLILQWSQDYATAPPQAVSQTVAPVIETDVPPAEPPAQAEAGSDVPMAISEDSEAATPAAPAASTASGDYIDVVTDTLNLRISLNGGDVVYASLPQYPFSAQTPDIPFTLLEESQRIYTAMSGLVGADGIDSTSRARFTADRNRFEMASGADQLEVILTHVTEAGLEVQKVYTLHRNDYLIDIRYNLVNNTGNSVTTNLFGQVRRDDSSDPSAGGTIGMASYLGAALTTPDDRYKKHSFRNMERSPLQVRQEGGWVAFLQHYFVSAWIPEPNEVHNFYARRLPNGLYYAGFQSPALNIAPGESGSTGTQLYLGPKDQDRLAEISPHLELTVDYGWLWWAAQPLFKLLQFMHGLVGNWGWAIVLMTLTVKIILYPLTAASYRSMARMRKFAPKMTQLREQYGDDRQKLGQEMMKLYKKEKLNPMGGCLPILVQMPIFIALYWVLMEAVELRQSPFIFWIEDLSIKDPFFVLPLLMGASMFLQMQMQQQPSMDPMQAKMLKFMPVVFTFMFLWFPAGLTLYWFINNVTTIVQQWMVNRKFDKAEAEKSKS
ncbi:MAG: membrane protein insertase YidC [Saccharospirillum sp.]|nr:membrane protein insertase YidC [Saccharospirillum sp.]